MIELPVQMYVYGCGEVDVSILSYIEVICVYDGGIRTQRRGLAHFVGEEHHTVGVLLQHNQPLKAAKQTCEGGNPFAEKKLASWIGQEYWSHISWHVGGCEQVCCCISPHQSPASAEHIRCQTLPCHEALKGR